MMKTNLFVIKMDYLMQIALILIAKIKPNNKHMKHSAKQRVHSQLKFARARVRVPIRKIDEMSFFFNLSK